MSQSGQLCFPDLLSLRIKKTVWLKILFYVNLKQGGVIVMDIQFSLDGMIFEYDEDKNRQNIIKHGI